MGSVEKNRRVRFNHVISRDAGADVVAVATKDFRTRKAETLSSSLAEVQQFPKWLNAEDMELQLRTSNRGKFVWRQTRVFCVKLSAELDPESEKESKNTPPRNFPRVFRVGQIFGSYQW